MKRLMTGIVLGILLLPLPSLAQVRSYRIDVDAGGRVPWEVDQTRSRSWTVFFFTVERLAPHILDVNLNLDMVHSWVEDLEIWLESPAGTSVRLFNQLPGGPPRFDDFDDTFFDDQAAQSITDGNAPYRGSFKPMEALRVFNGQNPNGIWFLWVYDHHYGDYGWLYRRGDPAFETRRGPLSGTYLWITVPEPASLLALAVGVVGLAVRRR